MMKRYISTEVRGGDAGKLIVDTMIEMMLMPGVSGIGEIARDERGGIQTLTTSVLNILAFVYLLLRTNQNRPNSSNPKNLEQAMR